MTAAPVQASRVTGAGLTGAGGGGGGAAAGACVWSLLSD